MKEAEKLFDEYAASYEVALSSAIAPSGETREYFAERRVKWLQRCLQERRETPRRVLDFGCGDGATTPVLLQILGAESALGLDASPKSIELALKKFANAQIKYVSLANFGPCGQFDLAYCNGVFHHIPPPERAAAVTVIKRALRPGGLFAFWENSPWSLASRYVMSRCAFDRDAIMISPPEARNLLQTGGFEILRTDFRFIFPNILRWLRGAEDFVYDLPFGAQYQVLCRKLS